jgi:hypothetical protein
LYIALLGAAKRKLVALIVGCFCLVGGYFATSQLAIWSKLTSLVNISQAPTDFDYSGNDLSGFALVSNFFVAANALTGSHYLGTGLNTHQFNYDAYLPTIFSRSQVIMDLNREDAGSLYIRVASEFGIPGLFAMLWFLFAFKVRTGSQESPYRILNDMCLVFLLVYGARTGAYLDIRLWLFAAIYYYTYKMDCTEFGRAARHQFR